MSYIPDLFVLQAGAEGSDWGDSDAVASVKLMGITNVTFSPAVDVNVFSQLRGSQAPGFETAVSRVGANASVDGILAYEDFPYFCDALFGKATAIESVGGDSDAWDRTYDAPLTTRDSDLAAPSIYTLAYGDASTAVTSSDTFVMSGATLQTLSLTGEDGGPITYSASFIGKQIVEGALVDLADRAVNIAMGDHVTVSIDPASDAAGTTPIANTAFSFALNVNTNRDVLYHLGSLTADGYRDAKWNGTLTLNLEITATTKAYMTDIFAASPSPVEKVVRLLITDTVGREVSVDFVGVVQGAPAIHEDNDGVVTASLTFSGKYQTDQAGWLTILATNATETLA